MDTHALGFHSVKHMSYSMAWFYCEHKPQMRLVVGTLPTIRELHIIIDDLATTRFLYLFVDTPLNRQTVQNLLLTNPGQILQQSKVITK